MRRNHSSSPSALFLGSVGGGLTGVSGRVASLPRRPADTVGGAWSSLTSRLRGLSPLQKFLLLLREAIVQSLPFSNLLQPPGNQEYQERRNVDCGTWKVFC